MLPKDRSELCLHLTRMSWQFATKSLPLQRINIKWKRKIDWMRNKTPKRVCSYHYETCWNIIFCVDFFIEKFVAHFYVYEFFLSLFVCIAYNNSLLCRIWNTLTLFVFCNCFLRYFVLLFCCAVRCLFSKFNSFRIFGMFANTLWNLL